MPATEIKREQYTHVEGLMELFKRIYKKEPSEIEVVRLDRNNHNIFYNKPRMSLVSGPPILYGGHTKETTMPLPIQLKEYLAHRNGKVPIFITAVELRLGQDWATFVNESGTIIAAVRADQITHITWEYADTS